MSRYLSPRWFNSSGFIQRSCLFAIDRPIVESRTVEVGQAYKQQWIIKKGLKKGERVIYDGLQKVRPGMVVKSKDKESTPKKS